MEFRISFKNLSLFCKIDFEFFLEMFIFLYMIYIYN